MRQQEYDASLSNLSRVKHLSLRKGMRICLHTHAHTHTHSYITLTSSGSMICRSHRGLSPISQALKHLSLRKESARSFTVSRRGLPTHMYVPLTKLGCMCLPAHTHSLYSESQLPCNLAPGGVTSDVCLPLRQHLTTVVPDVWQLAMWSLLACIRQAFFSQLAGSSILCALRRR